MFAGRTRAGSRRARNWFGVAVVISALVAVSGRTETKRLHTWLFFALGVILLVKIYDFGVLEWVGHVPVVELVVFPTFAPPVVSFAFAVLAGIGVQVLRSRDLRLRRFLTAPRDRIDRAARRPLSAGDRLRVIVEDACRRSGLRGRALRRPGRRRRRARLPARPTLGAVLLAGVIVAELFVLAPFEIYAKRADPYRGSGLDAARPEPLRRRALLARVRASTESCIPNTAGALGLQDIRALDALYVERYLRYVQTFIQPEVFDRFTGDETDDATPLRDNPMFDALGVRAVLSERDLANVPGLRLLGRDRDTRVYEKSTRYPRAWVVHDVHVVGGEDEAFAFLQARARRSQAARSSSTRFDPRREAVVEHDGKTTDETLRALQGGRIACEAATRDRVTHRALRRTTP